MLKRLLLRRKLNKFKNNYRNEMIGIENYCAYPGQFISPVPFINVNIK